MMFMGFKQTFDAYVVSKENAPGIVVLGRNWWGVDFEIKNHGKVGLDAAEAQHLMDGLDWQGAVKDIQAFANWLKANGSQKFEPQSKEPHPVQPKSALDSPAQPPLPTVTEPPTDSSQILSKIPIRPQKIRKLSSTTAAAAVESPQDEKIPSVTAINNDDGEVRLAIQHLRAADPLLANLIDAHPPPTFNSDHAPFLALTKSILYQ